MFTSKTLLSLALFSLTFVDGVVPPDRRNDRTLTSLSLNKRFNHGATREARVRSLFHKFKRNVEPVSLNITSLEIVYTAEVGIGNPPTSYALAIDTGTGNTWVGAGKQYVKTKSSHDTGNSFYVYYGWGRSASGEEWSDTVTLAPNLVVNNQSIGVANKSTKFDGVDGVLGVGPTDATIYTVANTTVVSTVMDNLYDNGSISPEVLGMYFVPANEDQSVARITIGGVDTSVTTSDVNYVPVTSDPAYLSSGLWGYNQTISYGGEVILDNSAGVLDSLTFGFYVPPATYQKYQDATGAVLDNTTGLLSFTSTQYANLKPFSLIIGEHSYDLTPNAQILPRSLNTAIGGSANAIYSIVMNLGPYAVPGFSFIAGNPLIERFYTVLDTTNKQIGLASTAYTDATSN